MKNHTKIYFDFFGIDYDIPTGYFDHIDCEHCGKQAVEIKHITPIDHGGKDNIDNLVALCNNCYEKACSGELPKYQLETVHLLKVCKYSY